MNDWDEFSKGCPWKSELKCTVLHTAGRYRTPGGDGCRQEHCAPYHFSYQMMITSAIKFSEAEVPPKTEHHYKHDICTRCGHSRKYAQKHGVKCFKQMGPVVKN